MVRISVVTPTFNSEKTIERNINSVINQSYKDFEHIIVDNNSKDSTLSLINKIYKDNGLSGILRTINEADNGISDAIFTIIINYYMLKIFIRFYLLMGISNL